jgi:uncharacterized protein YqeY
MTNPRELIAADIQDALRSGAGEKVSTLRLLLASLDNERIRSGNIVDEPSFYRLVQKAIKQRRESAEQFKNGGRGELADKEDREAQFLQAYLPPPVEDQEVLAAIGDFVEAEQLSGPRAIGVVMKSMRSRFSGRVDGADLNRLIRQVLEKHEP